jgi:hypothetical protein
MVAGKPVAKTTRQAGVSPENASGNEIEPRREMIGQLSITAACREIARSIDR